MNTRISTERLYSRQMSLREAIAAARSLGITVSDVTRTGEIVFTHPRYPRRVRVNTRRKDAQRIVLTMLRAIAEGDAPAAPTHVVTKHPLTKPNGHVAEAMRLEDHDKRDR